MPALARWLALLVATQYHCSGDQAARTTHLAWPCRCCAQHVVPDPALPARVCQAPSRTRWWRCTSTWCRSPSRSAPRVSSWACPSPPATSPASSAPSSRTRQTTWCAHCAFEAWSCCTGCVLCALLIRTSHSCGICGGRVNTCRNPCMLRSLSRGNPGMAT